MQNIKIRANPASGYTLGMTRQSRPLLFAAALLILGVTLISAVIWVPWFRYQYVPSSAIDTTSVEEARRSPNDALLSEIGGFDLGVPQDWKDSRQLASAAEKLLGMVVDIPGYEKTTLAFPFDAKAMASGPSKWQLFVHSFGLPRVLLDAYKAERRVEFLRAAADYLVAYDEYERSGWRQRGYLWVDNWRLFVRNDHAISARVTVLAEFWRLYRQSADYSPDVAKSVLRMAERYSYLLTDPARFTVATNHGVMQNLAACMLQLSFPAVEAAKNLCQITHQRLDEQLAFFINDEGFVLEHSPGYQGFDLRLIGATLRMLSLAKHSIPANWREKYQRAQQVYAMLRRPDGTLPVFGDTSGLDPTGPLVSTIDRHGNIGPMSSRTWTAREPQLLAPVAGYSVWWDAHESWPKIQRLAQTMVSWSYYPGMAHKHADEMSVEVWARGTVWWSNVGYWPYDDANRYTAESWQGSNAPHLVGEKADSKRKTRLHNHGWSRELSAVDLERNGPGSYRARRQVVHAGSRLWVVIDTSAGVDQDRTRTIWSTSPTVSLAPGRNVGEYVLKDASTGQSLHAFILGSPGITQRVAKGSQSPFSGWSAIGGKVQPVPAVVVERPVDGMWALSVWSLENGAIPDPGRTTALPAMTRWEGEDKWEMVLPTSSGEVLLSRNQERIRMHEKTADRTYSLKLEQGTDVSQEVEAIRTKFAITSAKYGAPEMSLTYRLKVTAVLLSSLIFFVGVMAILHGFRRTWALRAHFVLTATWLMLCYYFIVVRVPLV